MKLRHAAALALVGWYLMVPPVKWQASLCKCPLPTDGNWISEQNAPLTKWLRWKEYATGSDCEAARAERVVEKYWNRPHGNIYGRCIDNDDPRLKEK